VIADRVDLHALAEAAAEGCADEMHLGVVDDTLYVIASRGDRYAAATVKQVVLWRSPAFLSKATKKLEDALDRDAMEVRFARA
jgi:hypothetical protein